MHFPPLLSLTEPRVRAEMLNEVGGPKGPLSLTLSLYLCHVTICEATEFIWSAALSTGFGRPPTFFLPFLFLPQRGGFGRGRSQRQAAVAAPDTHETSLVRLGLCETDRQTDRERH